MIVCNNECTFKLRNVCRLVKAVEYIFFAYCEKRKCSKRPRKACIT